MEVHCTGGQGPPRAVASSGGGVSGQMVLISTLPEFLHSFRGSKRVLPVVLPKRVPPAVLPKKKIHLD